jgi:hypothetical protein
VGLGVAEPVFVSELSKFLLKYAPNVPAAIVKGSPTAIYTDIPADQIPGVLIAYAESLKIVFLVGVPVGEQRILQAFIYSGKSLILAYVCSWSWAACVVVH